MIHDPVVTDRVEEAILTDTPAEFDAPTPQAQQQATYRDLAWMGYTSTQIVKATGWNVSRIQRQLREQRHRAHHRPTEVLAHIRDATVTPEDHGLAIHTLDHTLILEGNNRDLHRLTRRIHTTLKENP